MVVATICTETNSAVTYHVICLHVLEDQHYENMLKPSDLHGKMKLVVTGNRE